MPLIGFTAGLKPRPMVSREACSGFVLVEIWWVDFLVGWLVGWLDGWVGWWLVEGWF